LAGKVVRPPGPRRGVAQRAEDSGFQQKNAAVKQRGKNAAPPKIGLRAAPVLRFTVHRRPEIAPLEPA